MMLVSPITLMPPAMLVTFSVEAFSTSSVPFTVAVSCSLIVAVDAGAVRSVSLMTALPATAMPPSLLVTFSVALSTVRSLSCSASPMAKPLSALTVAVEPVIFVSPVTFTLPAFASGSFTSAVSLKFGLFVTVSAPVAVMLPASDSTQNLSPPVTVILPRTFTLLFTCTSTAESVAVMSPETFMPPLPSLIVCTFSVEPVAVSGLLNSTLPEAAKVAVEPVISVALATLTFPASACSLKFGLFVTASAPFTAMSPASDLTQNLSPPVTVASPVTVAPPVTCTSTVEAVAVSVPATLMPPSPPVTVFTVNVEPSSTSRLPPIAKSSSLMLTVATAALSSRASPYTVIPSSAVAFSWPLPSALFFTLMISVSRMLAIRASMSWPSLPITIRLATILPATVRLAVLTAFASSSSAPAMITLSKPMLPSPVAFGFGVPSRRTLVRIFASPPLTTIRLYLRPAEVRSSPRMTPPSWVDRSNSAPSTTMWRFIFTVLSSYTKVFVRMTS